MIRTTLIAGASILALAACETAYEAEAPEAIEPTAADAVADVEAEAADVVEAVEETVEEVVEEASAPAVFDTAALAAVLAAQPEEVQARYIFRNPSETLEFFGVAPGMTVGEALPGGGWYSKILLGYLGEDGALVGAQYPDSLWPSFGMEGEALDNRIAAVAGWPEQAAEWAVPNAGDISHYYLTEAPETADASLDALLFIRALHNLHRFEGDGEFFSKTVAESFRVVKPGGVVGVVQHRAPEEEADEWADGNAGYLKQSRVVAAFEEAGFVLEQASEINANDKDTRAEGDVVWRLPPSLSGTEEGTPEQAAMIAIGESDRMTLRFRKPS